MADATRATGDRVFCHQCEHQWDRAHGGLTCPTCGSDFTEIIEHDAEPQQLPHLNHPQQRPSLPSSPRHPSPPPHHPLHHLLDHNPWNDALDPDPADDFTTFEFTSNNGGGRISFSTRTIRTGGGGIHNDRAMPLPFGNIHPFGTAAGQPAPFGGFPGGAFPRDPHAPVQAHNLQDMFSLILESMNPLMANDATGARGPTRPPAFDLLNQLFNPGNAQHGDMVYTQEGFDRVMTQLMEQQAGGQAPPPASEEAIQSLEQKKVDEEMLGAEGNAECSICMDNVHLGDQVTMLPCQHWFHGDCVVSWLKEHDTCPHCRKPISSPEQQQQAPSPRRRRPIRRASEIPSPPGGFEPEPSYRSRVSPIPESPRELREARRSFYGRSQGPEMERPDTIRQSSSQNGVGWRGGTRGGSGGSGGSDRSRSHSNGGGSGVTGWIRDHLPFS